MASFHQEEERTGLERERVDLNLFQVQPWVSSGPRANTTTTAVEVKLEETRNRKKKWIIELEESRIRSSSPPIVLISSDVPAKLDQVSNFFTTVICHFYGSQIGKDCKFKCRETLDFIMFLRFLNWVNSPTWSEPPNGGQAFLLEVSKGGMIWDIQCNMHRTQFRTVLRNYPQSRQGNRYFDTSPKFLNLWPWHHQTSHIIVRIFHLPARQVKCPHLVKIQ